LDQIQGGEAGANYFMHIPERPTAVTCFNDMMAIGVLKAFREAGIRVPEEISVVGFDDIPFAAYAVPALTTFEQPKYQLGYEAAKMMYRLLHAGPDDAPAPPQAKMLRGMLIIRESTAKPGM
jgi:DNA-binding LacI/PurR family transcriptional regulator